MKFDLRLVLLISFVITTSGCGKKQGDAPSSADSSNSDNPPSSVLRPKKEVDASQIHAWFKGEWVMRYDPTVSLVIIGADDSVKLNLFGYSADGTGRYDPKKGVYTTQIAPGKGGTPGKTFYKSTPEDFYIELRYASNTTPGEAPTDLNYKIYSMKYKTTAQEGSLTLKPKTDGKP